MHGFLVIRYTVQADSFCDGLTKDSKVLACTSFPEACNTMREEVSSYCIALETDFTAHTYLIACPRVKTSQ